MGFLTFIFWCIVAFYLLGWIGRLLLRNWIRRKQREFAGRFDQAGRAQRETRSGDHEGDVTIERIEIKEKQVNTKVGEYVEYEEVEEIDIKR